MVIDEKMIDMLEVVYRKSIPIDLRDYLLGRYSEEPSPYEYSEQDLYENIRKDIRRYESRGLAFIHKGP